MIQPLLSQVVAWVDDQEETFANRKNDVCLAAWRGTATPGISRYSGALRVPA